MLTATAVPPYLISLKPVGTYHSLLVRDSCTSFGFKAGQILFVYFYGELTEIWVNFHGIHTAIKLNIALQTYLSLPDRQACCDVELAVIFVRQFKSMLRTLDVSSMTPQHLADIITRRVQTSDATLLPAGLASCRLHVHCHSCSQRAVRALHTRFKRYF